VAVLDAPATVAGELLDSVLPVSEVLAKVSERELARAWLAGEVEFGRRSHVTTGRAGVKSERIGAVLIVEDGIEWTGPKTVRHKPFKELVAEAPPECDEYKQYVPADEPGQFKMVPVSKAEAMAALALVVRLTDKGLALLQ
jgi:hypothetical protein